MGPLQSEEDLRLHGGSMSPEQLRAAMLTVTGSTQEADVAAARREMQRVRDSANGSG